ncbi:pyrroloquinoline quinone biosynthesis peptide chaperone PqqD [Erwinia sp. BNK-24-b]|uniref:pyrroloquinoline quinone biosynthesis peptide chaperone PqqD n=1 Tax=Erwinia TaxID=551 RepID=UPI001FEED7AC|nr:pyrroloquinoline quinone biosynthesis peptide chaperone PqqD [Erwinia phyllosphaerae]MBV4367219.1 pyrroloquinoline quinone biosynthesis peptide chaperone PqqD [Erwinia phyllosphaerae]
MTLNDQQVPLFRRGYRLQWEPTQDCHVILYPEGMAKLNDSATFILQLVDGKRTLASLIAELNARFPDAGGVDEDVKAFFIQACEQKWIIFREPA